MFILHASCAILNALLAEARIKAVMLDHSPTVAQLQLDRYRTLTTAQANLPVFHIIDIEVKHKLMACVITHTFDKLLQNQLGALGRDTVVGKTHDMQVVIISRNFIRVVRVIRIIISFHLYCLFRLMRLIGLLFLGHIDRVPLDFL